MQNIAVVCSLHGDGDLIVDSVANLSGVFVNPVALGVLYLFIDSGHIVLLVDGSIGFGGIQTAQNTQRSVYQIVAEVRPSNLTVVEVAVAVFVAEMLFWVA